MIKVNSLSGGKTSSYMAAHYPADYNIFSLVRIDADYCKPKDKSIVKYVSDKIGMDFIATAESDITLYTVRDLEQLIGKEIIWVTGDSFDNVIKIKKALPNIMWRFCTTEMKMRPIFEWWYNNFHPTKINMTLGIRYDEKHRAFNEKTGKKKPDKSFKHIISKNANGKNKWAETDWRVSLYPLVSNKINHFDVVNWANESGIIFPPDSNCVGCFWKPYQQLRKNWDEEPLKMRWFSELEEKMKRTFKNGATYEQIKTIGLQQDFNFGTGSGCQAGFCTD